MAFSLTGAGTGGLTGAMGGAQLGTSVPVIGPTYGALAGGAIGALSGAFSGDGNSAKAIQDQLNLGIMTQASNIEAARESMKWSEGQAGETRNFNSAQAVQQMQFQERMASTQHQREIADLKAAGLNPILSGMGGSGSAAPSGSAGSATTPSASQAHVGNPYDSYAGDVISAQKLQSVEKVRVATELARAIADIQKTQEQTKTEPVTREAIAASGRLDIAKEIKQQYDIDLSELDVKNYYRKLGLTDAQIKNIEGETALQPFKRQVLQSEAARNLQQASLNSANKYLYNSMEDLNRYDYRTRPNETLATGANSAKKVGDSVQSILEPWMEFRNPARKTMRVPYKP